jgi:predicted nucleotide-binding protein
MARLPIEIIDLREKNTPDLKIAVEEANSLQSEVEFSVLGRSFADDMRLFVLSDTHTGSFFSALQDKKREWRGFHPYIICFVDSALHSDKWGNLFSSRRAEHGIGIVTSSKVEEVVIPKGKMSSYYLYELATHTLALIVSGKKHHDETRECIYDFQEQKIGVLDGIKAGKLCDECRAWFQVNGKDLSSAQLSAISDILRRCGDLLEQVPHHSEKPKPRIFIGSSSEGIEIARVIQSELHRDFSVEIWNQNTVFGLGTATIEALETAVESYDFGIFVFTPDDEIIMRDAQHKVPRDNVIFELGLFIGKLGRFKAFAVQPQNSDIQLPSDLKGMSIASYDPESINIDAALGPACRQIRLAVKAAANIYMAAEVKRK